MKKPNFSGIATAYNIKCSDGRVIMPSAFAHQDGVKVPLVWRHQHKSIDNVLGHGILHSEPSGMRIDAYFNKTVEGNKGRLIVESGDIEFLSVFANQVTENAGQVAHGFIRETSLVYSGANPGAFIDNVILHSDDPMVDDAIMEDELIIRGIEPITIRHEESSEKTTSTPVADKTVAEILSTFSEPQKDLLSYMLMQASGMEIKKDPNAKDSGPDTDTKAVYESLSEEQQTVLHILVGEVLSETEAADKAAPKGETQMQQSNDGYNIAQGEADMSGAHTLSHEEFGQILGEAQSTQHQSLRKHFSTILHAGDYGLDNIELLFPDYQDPATGGPMLYMDDQEWVNAVVPKASKSPFSKVKSKYADITQEEARARGYITGNEKFEAVFPIFSRKTDAKTILIKEKLDRDDLVDITDFDVIAWMKKAMRIKMDEELARAILVGDGRAINHEDKIDPTCLRPIYTDDDIYSHKILFPEDVESLDIVDGVMEADEFYKGAGNKTLFCAPSFVTGLIKVRDLNGRRIYETREALAAAMQVGKIITVPLLSNYMNPDDPTKKLLGIAVNMRDYTIGANKGGEVSFFDDFDIDFNQYKYLFEARLSGALTKPKSAIVFEQTITP